MNRGASVLYVGPSADAVILDETCYCLGAVLTCAAAAGILTVWDGPVANSKEVLKLSCPVNDTRAVMFTAPVAAASLRYTLTGAAAEAGVHFSKN